MAGGCASRELRLDVLLQVIGDALEWHASLDFVRASAALDWFAPQTPRRQASCRP